jgi:hypothetical protein
MARERMLKIRVDAAELEALKTQAAAAGVTVADLVRAALTAKPSGLAPRRRRREPDPGKAAIAREIARVGNNLNQVARWANTYKNGAEAVQVIALLMSIERGMNRHAD